jgi:hypothetical protein
MKSQALNLDILDTYRSIRFLYGMSDLMWDIALTLDWPIDSLYREITK